MDRRVFNQSLLGAGFAAALPSSVLAAAIKSATRITADINAVTRTGGETTVTKAALKEFQASLRGPLIMPGNANYEAARQVWNGMIDKHPAMIARCTGSADVMQAVDFARDNDLLVAVRGGGHSISGKGVCEGGLVIDLSALRGCRVDPAKKTARLAGGVFARRTGSRNPGLRTRDNLRHCFAYRGRRAYTRWRSRAVGAQSRFVLR